MGLWVRKFMSGVTIVSKPLKAKEANGIALLDGVQAGGRTVYIQQVLQIFSRAEFAST
jgi:hypothetical protein